MATKSRLWTDTPTHPGELLADELAARELTPARLAKEAGLDLEELESVMRGESRVEAVMAWALEGAFEGLSARFWMGLQSDYDLGMAKLALEH